MEPEDQNSNGGRNNGEGRAVGDGFPKATLERALNVAIVIERANAGNPYPPIDTAQALDLSPGSSGFRTLLAASFQYGFTSGSYKSDRISLRELGRSVTAPRTPDDQSQSMVAAALTPPAFRWLFDFYKGKALPEAKYMVNTVARELGIPAPKAEKCVEIFLENIRLVGLTRDTKGGEWLSAEADAVPTFDVTHITNSEDGDEEGLAADLSADELDDGSNGRERTPVLDRPKSSALFVGARRGKARDQLTKTLDGLGIPYKVAEEEPNLARPISNKVRETMEACGAGILIFTADEEYRDKDGEEVVWKPSENVIHELGAASILYGDRIVVFKEKAVRLASNYSSIGYIEFEKDKLDAQVNDLLRELFAFKIIAVQVGA